MKHLEEVLSWRIECLKLNHNWFEVTIGITFLSFSYLAFTITILKLQTVWRLELYVFMTFLIIIVLCLQQECVMIWHYNFFFEIQSTLRKLGILNDRWTAYIWIKWQWFSVQIERRVKVLRKLEANLETIICDLIFILLENYFLMYYKILYRCDYMKFLLIMYFLH